MSATDVPVDDELEPFPEHRRPVRWARWLLALALVVLLVVAAVGVWVQRQVDPPGGVGPTVSISIPKGSSSTAIARLLAREHVITNTTVFRLYLRIEGAGPFQAGNYSFRRHDHMGHVVSVLEAGPHVVLDRLTIPEGSTLTQVADRVGQLPGRSRDAFLAAAASGEVHSAYQPAGSTSLEGLLYPDTYFVTPTDNEMTLLKRMVGAFDQVAAEVRLADSAAALHVTPYQLIVVASMVEREAKVDEDRGKIARVIYNRLASNTPLGIDATIEYAVGQKPTLTKRDLQIDSPYNTRTHRGLPPTPIASPGRKSIAAAADPTPGSWLYYVLADSDGHHAFATTAAEFNRLVAESRAKGLLP